jgi:hypothetical protein
MWTHAAEEHLSAAIRAMDFGVLFPEWVITGTQMSIKPFHNLHKVDMVLVGIGRSHQHIFTTKFSINSHSQNWIKFYLNEIRK